jgi:hypothetical protein
VPTPRVSSEGGRNGSRTRTILSQRRLHAGCRANDSAFVSAPLENLVRARKFLLGLKLGKNIVWDEVAVAKFGQLLGAAV